MREQHPRKVVQMSLLASNQKPDRKGFRPAAHDAVGVNKPGAIGAAPIHIESEHPRTDAGKLPAARTREPTREHGDWDPDLAFLGARQPEFGTLRRRRREPQLPHLATQQPPYILEQPRLVDAAHVVLVPVIKPHDHRRDVG
jgi:hypothetical protein